MKFYIPFNIRNFKLALLVKQARIRQIVRVGYVKNIGMLWQFVNIIAKWVDAEK